MDKERWLPVVGYEGYYEVSDLGRVRSLDRFVTGGRGGKERLAAGKVLRPQLDDRGYPQIRLYRDGYRWIVRVGVLVLMTFVGPRPEGMVMCHAVGSDKEDCRLAVLRWDTRGSNRADYFGNRHLTDEDIVEMRERRAAGETTTALAEEFDRSPRSISAICQGTYYARVGGPRTFGRV